MGATWQVLAKFALLYLRSIQTAEVDETNANILAMLWTSEEEISLGKRYSQTQILLRHIHFNPLQNENSQTIVGIMFGNYYDQSQKYIRPRAVISNIFTTFAPYNYISCQEL